jgi:hypothetical protein
MQPDPFDGARLLRLTSALQDAVPYYTSIQAEGRVERLDLHSLPEAQFGEYDSKQRLYTITNATNYFLSALGYFVEGLAGFPSMQRGSQLATSLSLYQERLRGRLLTNGTVVSAGTAVSADQVLADSSVQFSTVQYSSVQYSSGIIYSQQRGQWGTNTRGLGMWC